MRLVYIDKIIKKLWSYIKFCILIFFSSSIFFIVLYKYLPVKYTPLMLLRNIENFQDSTFKTNQIWRSINDFSPYIVKSAIASEDIRFFIHNGIDWKSVKIAKNEYRYNKRLRGASTISQQTAKNVFLLPSGNWFRKAIEVYITYGIELFWGKQRILEVYLNVVEMGQGIYGAEAAAQIYFHKPASKLTRRESALIIACLPNPLQRTPSNPTLKVQKRAEAIEQLTILLPFPDSNINTEK